ncbi:MAG TPA: Clp protease N-terminal domain-containing protein [Candidatus Eisenbacteria bacterium]|nr:Clp protease N-terminal domain-containing protein [Candidatus Eisenbacteria bacterium]
MYPFERFSGHARKALTLAQDEAANLGHGHIGTEHLLLGLVQEAEGLGARALAAAGVCGTAAGGRGGTAGPGRAEAPSPDHPDHPGEDGPRPRLPVCGPAGPGAGRHGPPAAGAAEGNGLGAVVLRNLGADEAAIREAVDRLRKEDGE